MPWPLGTHLVAKTGEELSRLHSIHLPLLSPGTETSVSLDFQAPTSSGVYHCQWRACTAGGALFGGEALVFVIEMGHYYNLLCTPEVTPLIITLIPKERENNLLK